jgi:hypothetical protein
MPNADRDAMENFRGIFLKKKFPRIFFFWGPGCNDGPGCNETAGC